MPSHNRVPRTLPALLLLLAPAFALGAPFQAQPSPQAQQSPDAAPAAGKPTQTMNQPNGKPGLVTRPVKPPALVEAAGPAVTLQSSEALFDIAVALNACGYDAGLDHSDPLRLHVRAQVNEALQQSANGRDARDRLCTFIGQHHLSESSRDLAQYVSLALYVTPPPDLTPSVDQQDMPPDSTQVVDMLPLLRDFANDIKLHLIWLENHPAYEAETTQLHDPLTQMILDTNIYLKMPTSAYNGSRFLVVIEPLLSPKETNARVYGTDYVVVSSPVDGKINMKDVRHTYLQYMIEPLLYSRASSMDRLLPLLKTVRDAPLEYVYRSDIVSLVIESMINAIEARTLDPGVPIVPIPADVSRVDLPRVQREHDESVQKSNAVRQKVVNASMTQGYVLTQYFFDQLGPFARNPESLREAIGPMVYGMDVDQQTHRAREIQFAEQGETHATTPRPGLHLLDQAELKLKQGDASGASLLARQALKDHTDDPARADYVLALTWLLKNDMQSAESDFAETVRLTKDPRLLAWSHIYLGRIHDVKEERDEAVAEYRTALTVRDGQQDTRDAAQKGIDQPFAPPHRAHAKDPDDEDDEQVPDSRSPASKPGAGSGASSGGSHPAGSQDGASSASNGPQGAR